MNQASKVEISMETLRRWYQSLEGYHPADVPDTVATRCEIADLLGILDESEKK